MKKVIFTLTICLYSLMSFAQYSTKGFAFQGYASDPEGKALGSVGITVKFTLYSGTNVNLTYAEEQNTTTDAYGVFSATVGTGTSVGAETKTPFAALNMNLYTYKLKVEVKKTAGGSYTTLSDEELKSVPHARSADNGAPVGAVMAFAGPEANIPDGWVKCDGTIQDGTDEEWQALFEVIGTSWGGSGTSFRIPDMRGQFLRGVDDGSTRDDDRAGRVAAHAGGNTGDQVASYQLDQYRAHSHGMNAAGNHNHGSHLNADQSGVGLVARDGANTIVQSDSDGAPFGQLNLHRLDIIATDGNHTHAIHNSGGTETRPENVTVYYIIKK